MTSFAALVQDYVHLKTMAGAGVTRGRMVAIVGDAELDEGNVFEALLEGWKHDIRNVWWVIDYNRQSLDAIVTDRLFYRFDNMFRDMGWRVVTMKYGRRMEAGVRPRPAAMRCGCGSTPVQTCCIPRWPSRVAQAWRAQLLADIGDAAGRAGSAWPRTTIRRCTA